MVKKKSPAINLYFYSKKNSDIIIVYFHQTKHISKKKIIFSHSPWKMFLSLSFFSIIFSAIGEL